MTLQNYLVIVVGEDDNESSSIMNRVDAEFHASSVAFVHAPIGSNDIVTINGLHDILVKSSCNFVIVAITSALDKTDIESAVAKFSEEHTASQKPLLRKRFNSANFEWCRQCDLASVIVVAKRTDLLGALKAQMSHGQILTKPTEGGD